MQKLFLSFLGGCLIFICFSQNGTTVSGRSSLLAAYLRAEKTYLTAERIALQSDSDETLVTKADEEYHKALEQLQSLLPAVEKTGYDSLSFFIQLKSGIICHYFDSLAVAKKYYLNALQFRNNKTIADSFFFKPLLYSGSIHYTGDKIDSALYFLKQAEQINDWHKGTLSESQRLYNLFGVIHYETGNYRQAVIYFEKALSLLSLQNPQDNNLRANYRINIASTLMKMEEYDRAKKIFVDAANEKEYSQELNHKLGIICLKENKNQQAIEFFRKTVYNNKKSTDLFLNMAMAFAGLGQPDSSALYVLKAKEENLRWNGNRKNITNGLILKFQADELVKINLDREALDYYQQAIRQFCIDFNETNVEKNPETFGNVFSYINLFNTLESKADAFERLYQPQKDIKDLENALATYQAAFSLAGYVEKSYYSDEARLFLGKLKYAAHNKPIELCLLLYNLTQKKEYLESAYRFDQQNKASVLALNIQENELKNKSSTGQDLVEKETSLKTSLARLLMKSAQLTDSQQLQSVYTSISDHEIQLGKLQEQLNEVPSYRSQYFTSRIPTVRELQQKLDNRTALLSWHLSKQWVIVFLISGNQFQYHRSPLDSLFFKKIDSLKSSLYNNSSDQRYNGASVSADLYKVLMEPLESKLSGMERLIIIPDDELNYLPFEALQGKNGRYLIEKFSIQYQYSAALLGKENNTVKASGLLAFAPFVTEGFRDTSGKQYSALPGSGTEISGLEGKIFTGNNAIKNNFLLHANHYGIIHLATHASADNEMPLRSFIAFHPLPGEQADDYKLYAQEIYNLRLDSTQLVILSACETGTGKLVKGEGLMSLSRAFAYAGCPDIITSLWKAEDKTTAFITQQLHHYLEKGNSNDKALQQSKLDLLKSDETDPRFKTPNYWANLVFIGNYEPRFRTYDWWWVAIGIIIAALLYLFAINAHAKKKRLSQN